MRGDSITDAKTSSRQYTIFGEVTEGLEVIDRIATVATDRYDRPYEDVMIISVTALNTEPETVEEAADSTTVQPADSASVAGGQTSNAE